MSTAYFAGGCFWCITPTFREMDGVRGVISGYSGGSEENPAYEDVKLQRTGHRETIRIDYDEAKVSFDELLAQFLIGADGALSGFAAHCQLAHHNDETNENGQQQINDQEGEAAGASHLIGEAPDVAQTNGGADGGQQEAGLP